MLFKSSFLLLLLTFAVGISASPLEIEARDRGLAWCKKCTPSPDNCHISAPCSNFLGKLYCGCRPGYRASHIPVGSPKQWRINTVPGHEHRVWVAPGVACNTRCANAFGVMPCSEVPVRNICAPRYELTANADINADIDADIDADIEIDID